MQLYYHVFPALSLMSGCILASLGFFSLARRRLPGTGLFTLLMFAGAVIAVFYFFEVACVELRLKYFFLRMQFFGTATLSAIWLLVASHFCGFRKLLLPKYVVPLFILPVITIALVWTNDYHSLFWREIGIGREGEILYLANTFGYWNWVHLFYTYSTFIIGSVLFIRHAVKSKGLHRSQSIAFLIAALFPWLLNVVFSINIFPWAKFDVSPLSFAVTGIALWWAVFRYHLLDIMPAAKDMVMENIRAGIIVSDSRDHVLEINGFMTDVFSIQAADAVGKPLEAVWKELELEPGGTSWAERERYFEIDTTPITNSKGDTAGKLHLIFDITEKKKADLALKKTEELLFQSQKIEALGRLSEGIAHEFNNILTIVYNYSKYTNKENVQEIHSAVRRGQELTKQLLTFSRKHVVEKDLLLLSEVLSGLTEFLREMVKKETVIVFLEEAAPGLVLANRHQIEQLILNLVKNADDAMPEGGNIHITAGAVVLREGSFAENRSLAPGPYAFIRISDTGEGMSGEIRKHIFDPFFTTRDVGKGTGLGLSTVYGIVKQYKGHIDVRSSPGKGATFTVYLPSYSSGE
jgi:signal transduction histidine kinase